MDRVIDPRLQQLYDDGVAVYSISKLDTINNCLYNAYRSYILHKRGKGNVYSSLGGKTHDVLEGITNGTHTEKDLLPSIREELQDLEMMGFEFPKDRNGGDSIKEGWIADMEHFATTYIPPKRKQLTAEEFFLYITPKGYTLQGYIDLQKTNSDGSIDIYDYKTSSMYNSQAIKEHQRQLILYALGKEQEGFKVRSSSWIFLKYADVSFVGKKTARSKNKTQITKTIERKKIGSEMAKYVEGELLERGYDEIEIESYLAKLIKTNKFDHLPDDIKEIYTIKPCVKKVELTEENKAECIQYIEDTIERWESLTQDESAYVPRSFLKTQKNGKVITDVFFCTNLCDHYKECYHIQDFLTSISDSEDDDLF